MKKKYIYIKRQRGEKLLIGKNSREEKLLHFSIAQNARGQSDSIFTFKKIKRENLFQFSIEQTERVEKRLHFSKEQDEERKTLSKAKRGKVTPSFHLKNARWQKMTPFFYRTKARQKSD